VRENRLHGSEGGEGESPFRPLSTTYYRQSLRRFLPVFAGAPMSY